MTTLAADKPRAYETGYRNDIPVVASDIIYEGAAVSVNSSGYARPLNTADGKDAFVGFATRQADNSSGAAGDINVNVLSKGLIELAVTSVAITDLGADVFASDDNTFVLTGGANVKIGKVYRFVSSGIAVVEFDAQTLLSPAYTVVYAGEFTTEGGDTTETIAVTGVLATDLVHVTLHTAGATPVTIVSASASADQIDVVTSANPSTDHVLTYSVLRAIA